MNVKFRSVVTGVIIFLLGLTGCSTSQPSTSNHSNETAHNHSDESKKLSNNEQLEKAFQAILNGLTTIEKDIAKGDYKDASTVADQLHEEFHAAILPPLKEKKGNSYAEDIHSKYDELQDAIKDKNTTNISKLIKNNRDNLHAVAGILGISLQ